MADEVWVISEVVDYEGGEVLAVCRTLEGARAFAEEHGTKQMQEWLELPCHQWAREHKRCIE